MDRGEYEVPGQSGPVAGSDRGLVHFAVWVDDIEQARERFARAGGTILSPVMEIAFSQEAGEDNRYCFCRTPWGVGVEMIMLPSEMGYESETDLRRWQRQQRLAATS